MKYFHPYRALKTKLKNLKIMKQLLLFFFCISIIPIVLIGALSFVLSSNIIQNKAQSYAFETIQQLSDNIDGMLRQIETMSISIAYNGTIQEDLYQLQEGRSISREELFALEQSMIVSYDYSTMRDITILSNNKNYFRVPYSIDNYSGETISRYGGSLAPHKCAWINNSANGVIQMLRPIEGAHDFKRIGTLSLSIYSSAIDNQISKINFDKSGQIFVLDTKLEPVTAKDKGGDCLAEIRGKITGDSGSFAQKRNGENTLFFYKTSPLTGWKTIGTISMDRLFREVHTVRIFVLAGILLMSFLAVVISGKMSGAFSKRITRVVEAMQLAAEGDFSAQLPVNTTNEFGKLSAGFNFMVKKINSLIDTAYKARLLQQESELKALQAQINPHFLYNTLDTICWQAKLHGCEDVCQTVIALAHLMRVSVDNKKAFISVQEEMAYVGNYVLIQKARYREKIQVFWEIDPELNSFPIPKLILQPVVENAFVHGLEMKKGNGIICITGKRIGETVSFEVEDNGVGISREQLENIFSEAVPSEKNSLGIINVHRRIQLIYGEEYGIRIESEEGKGTRVTLVFPVCPPRR